ncbi:SsrA-binding protein SmpB [Geomicrobium sp. JCM 19039]|uniref:SsrA-binding protein SmpB n=1 Tax=Geomicrobium sp. JCM 19039 TaxID=1460636 RepID=UPI00045F46BE|nr:SsrA-binding protein SmpB [Geomicrobium sp. JCM 19039]GAK13184.1 tmRNA-binding protein SmpB [Geomicrobium sp. JCM 19039]
MAKNDSRVLAQNRKANHEFFIEETIEAGIVLKGTEIKSIRAGQMNIKESFARIEDGEVLLYQAHINPYEQGNRHNHDPVRTRKLLMHKQQIKKLTGKAGQQGYALVPLKVYIKNGFAKVLIGLGKGKKNYDKRESLKKKDAKRQMEKVMGQRMKGME